MAELADDVGFLLSRASGIVVRSVNAALSDHGLRVRQYSVLVLVCDSESGLPQREIAATLGLDPSQIVLLVDELERADLVRRAPSPADRRSHLVVATERGHATRAAAQAAATVALDGHLRRLTATETSTLIDLLRRVIDDE